VPAPAAISGSAARLFTAGSAATIRRTWTILEERSHRRHHRRQPTWSSPLADRVLALRLRYPRWGKLAVLLRQTEADGFDLYGRAVSSPS